MQTLQLRGQLRVRQLSRPAELVDQGGLWRGIDVCSEEDGGGATRALDLDLEPFEVFAGLGIVRQHIHGLFHSHGAELLEKAPRSEPGVGGARGWLSNE